MKGKCPFQTLIRDNEDRLSNSVHVGGHITLTLHSRVGKLHCIMLVVTILWREHVYSISFLYAFAETLPLESFLLRIIWKVLSKI